MLGMASWLRASAHLPLILLITLGIGCGEGGETDPDGGLPGCPTHAQPSFELGTGAEHFEPLVEGQVLRMAPGLQGGCHFWLSVRTDGFAERLFNIEYDLRFAASSTPTGSASGQRVRLRPAEALEGQCEYTGYTAFIVEPHKLVGKDIRIDVKVTDDLGRSATASRTVRAEYPEVNASLCMPR